MYAAGIEKLLNRYCDEIERFNPAYGLVKAASREELLVKHINDSLAPLEIIRGRLAPLGGPGQAARPGGQVRLADAGSGAGLPGIPLAICLPGVHFTLIERSGRRAGFLRNTIAVLALANVTVEEAGIEDAPPGRFHGVLFRAFRPLEPGVLKSLFRLLADRDQTVKKPEAPAAAGGRGGEEAPEGFLAAYKGRRERIEAELAGSGLPAGSWELHPLAVPSLNEERHLVIIRRPPGVR